ncbi:unnamed protein product [Dibothriocephalus latus]|uniref:Macroglobulin domain-containing protein n=1 Tax=Dibothriocephalus latus TaxID=60516 RepID=A0A3P6Q165_DIBLA|nr:unnamed protein product [Dibothriocephalus latus]
MVTFTDPRTLHPDLPYRFQLRSVYPLLYVTVRYSAYRIQGFAKEISYLDSQKSADGEYVNEVQCSPQFVTEEGGAIKLTVYYLYCLPDEKGNDRACNNTRRITQHMYPSFARKFVVILGESNKPVYKPGGNIRFRFIALNTRQLYPSTERREWPEVLLVMRTYNDARVVRVTEEERRRREGSLGFDVIYVEDPSGNRVKEWRNVSQTMAFNMSFPLLPDASEGVWRLVARVFSSIQTLQVRVENYVLPRFLATIQVPKEVEIDAERAYFKVCAKYTNRNPFQGRYDVQICVAFGTELRQRQNLGTPFKNDGGTMGETNSSRPPGQCLSVAGSLFGTADNGGCVSASFSMKSLMQHVEMWVEEEYKLDFLVKISETDTGSTVTQFGLAEIRPPKLDVEIDSTYRPGLPIYGNVRLPQMNTPARPDSVRANLTLFK